MEMKFCHSCGMPLAKGYGKVKDNYCQYCIDEKGNLKPRQEVQKGIASWLKQITPESDADFMKRADYYLKAMPAWAEE